MSLALNRIGREWRAPFVKASLLLMETLWVYAVCIFLVALLAHGERPTVLGAGAVVFASFAISRFLQNTDLTLGLLRFWGVILSLLVFYVIVRIDFYGDLRLWDFTFVDGVLRDTQATLQDDATAVVGIPVLWAFWMRGIMRGQVTITFEDVMGSFAIGVIIVAVVALLGSVFDALPAAAGLVPVPYVAIGLLAIGLAHASRAEHEYHHSFAPHWLLAVGGIIGAIGIIALFFVIVDLGTAAWLIGQAARGIGWVLAGIFYVVLFPILKVMEWFFEFIAWLTRDLMAEQEVAEAPEGEPPAAQPEAEGGGLPGWLDLSIRVLVAGSLVGGVLVGLMLMFRRFYKPRRPGGIKESTYQEGRLASDLGDLLGSLLGRLRPAQQPPPAELEPARRLYLDMLASASARGVDKRPAETPLEFSPRLSRAYRAETPQRITLMFDDARYGAIVPPRSEVDRLRADWERLEQEHSNN